MPTSSGHDVGIINVSDFEFSSSRGREPIDVLEDIPWIDIETADGQVPHRVDRLLYYLLNLVVSPEERDSKAPVIFYVREIEMRQVVFFVQRYSAWLKDVISKHNYEPRVTAHIVFCETERLSDTARFFLHCILDTHTELAAVSEKLYKATYMVAATNQEHILYPEFA